MTARRGTTTRKRCRDISDKICRTHGLSVIEKPKYHANQKYADWLARQKNVSWKTRLCDDIDKIVLREDVKTVEDLAERLREKGYTVTLKKYLSIKAAKNRKAVRSLRLGDGYGIEELQYRIENKDREISLSAVAKYQGIQREYAMCLRELQITVYRKNENSHNVTYGQELDKLRSELSDTEKNLEAAESEKRQAAENYKTYLRQMQSDYDRILERLKREQEEIRIAEQEQQREQERPAKTGQEHYR